MPSASGPLGYIPGSDLLSHAPAHAVPSAVADLTSVFGMGTGVTLLLWPPGNLVSGVPAFAGRRNLRRPGFGAASQISAATPRGGVAPEHRQRATGYPEPERARHAEAPERRAAAEYPAIDRSLTTHPQRASEYGQASRLISIGQLNVSLRFHTRPINLVVYQEPSGTFVQGDLILWRVSRLDAFSVSPFRT